MSDRAQWGGFGARLVDFDGTLYVRPVLVDRDGYDLDTGAYFGDGAPLFLVSEDNMEVSYYVRANSMDAALDMARRHYPLAKVRRVD